MSANMIMLNKEEEITRGLGRGLEDAYKEAKTVDKQIAKTLAYHVSPLRKIPILNKISAIAIGVKPLPVLEGLLRKSINDSLVSLVKVGEEAEKENEKIKSLEEVIKIAKEQKWETYEFLSFIENNTDIDYKVNIDGKEYDFKEIITQVNERTQNKETIHKEYFEWIENHLELRKNYKDAMQLLCLIGTRWIGNSSRSYFDLTQLRGGMEQIRKTIECLGEGAISSYSSQEALKAYGQAYIKAMRKLHTSYQELNKLRAKGNQDQFREQIKSLEASLNEIQTETTLKEKTNYLLPEPKKGYTIPQKMKEKACIESEHTAQKNQTLKTQEQ